MANETPWAYKNVVAAETVTLRPSGANGNPGVLGCVNVNTVGTGTIIIYDNTAASGNIIASITVTALGYYEFCTQSLIGLTYIRSNADGNITITYR